MPRHSSKILFSVCVLFSVVATRTSAQITWAKTYDAGGGGGAADVRQTPDGGFLAAGWTKPYIGAPTDMWLVRLDASGTPIWQQSYGGSARDEIETLHPTPDGGYIAIGLSGSFGAGQHAPLVLKFDANGNVQWQKTYLHSGRDWGFDIVQTSDGGYVIPGMTDPCACGGTTQGTIIKTDANGNILWQKIYSGQGTFNSIRQTPDGGYIMGGSTASFGNGGGDALVLKLDSNGNIQWQYTYGGIAYETAARIQLTSDGGYIFAGTTYSFGSGGGDAWIVKLNSDGTVGWQKAYGGTGYEDAEYIEQTADGGYIVSGQTTTGIAAGTNLWVFKIDGLGNLAWERRFDNGSQTNHATAVHPTSDGGYIVAGFSEPGCPGCIQEPVPQNFTVLKLKSDGSIDPSCATGVGTPINATSAGTSATVLAAPLVVSDYNANANKTNVAVTGTNAQVTTLCSSEFLSFPLHAETPFTATISTVMDHHISKDVQGNPQFYASDNFVDAYTGEEGALKCAPATSPCAALDKQGNQQSPAGYKNTLDQPFVINGHYTGGRPCYDENGLLVECKSWLFYEGHPGYDYPADLGTYVFAPADGVAFIPDCDPVTRKLDCTGTSPGTAVDGFNILAIDHGNGYSTWYLHMGDLEKSLGESATIPSSPFQVTVTHAVFQSDLGVVYAANPKKKLKSVTSNPSSGQYTVSPSGIYTFSAADSGLGVLISYYYSVDFRVISCPGQASVTIRRGDGQRVPVTPECTVGQAGNKAIDLSNNPITLGAHLHFEVRKGMVKTSAGGYQCAFPICVPVDPYGWLPDSSVHQDPYPFGPNVRLWK